MASLTKVKGKAHKKTGKRSTMWRIDFFLEGEPKRKHLWLGKIAKQQAETVKSRVEYLVSARENGTAPDAETSRWTASIGDELHSKIASHGLIAPRTVSAVQTLKQFLDGYVAKRSDVKDSTSTVYGHTRRCLVEYFGPDKKLEELTCADAIDWRRWLAQSPDEGGQGLSDNTVRRRCGIARQFLTYAVDSRLIVANPFAKIKGVAVRENRSRDYFITRNESQLVLNACPDSEWRLIFALCRYGGLRCPSEVLSLQWSDIHWGQDRMKVVSPKTEHHEGKQFRIVPIFPELRPFLEALHDEAQPVIECQLCTPVITRYRATNSNLRTQLNRIIRRAGLKPWPKLFQNLRSTRETELLEDFKLNVVADWIGNTPAIALKHYLQTTDADFEKAIGKAHLQAQQQAVVHEGIVPHGAEQNCEYSEEGADPRMPIVFAMGDAGLEPATSAL
jgi:integrase